MTRSGIDRAETAEHMADAVTYLQRVALRAGFDGIAAELAVIVHRLKSIANEHQIDRLETTNGTGNKH